MATSYITGKSYFDNGYQPNKINGKTLQKTGKTVGQTYLKGSTSWGGKNMDSQQVWSADGKQWVWVRTGDRTGYYIQYMPEYEYNRNNVYKGGINFTPNAVDMKTANYKYRAASTNVSSNPLSTKSTAPTNKTNNTNNTTTTNTQPIYNYDGGGGGGTDPAISTLINMLQKQNEKMEQRIYELEHPKVWSAQELADFYGMSDIYNEDYWLKDYNKKTNDYYNAAIETQRDLRDDYAANNADQYRRMVGDYVDAYKNTAQTSNTRGTVAANTLSTMLGSGQNYAEDDYNLLQTENYLEEMRKADLANNPWLARQQYNNIGTYLSSLSAQKNASDVKQYVDTLDAYGQMYAADRAAQGLANQGIASKYNGLAQAQAVNAQTAAQSYATQNQWLKNYNYYMNITGRKDQDASSYLTNNLRYNQGYNQKTG